MKYAIQAYIKLWNLQKISFYKIEKPVRFYGLVSHFFNSKNFIKRIKDNLSLNIRCIDGKSESYLGGLAALNLLSPFKDGTTLDIGGGSSELCLIKNNRIISCISLDIGTVRLKELFYDT
ncbi:MAG: hypothetical protein K2J59_02205, partial [Eubacterium sp.]|nr:hypothetical protein [Eubacterium sp.]